ncbi:MAG TPA: hypothetical protein PK875_13145 [Spirochaetota bacterium]|nr:hypothetical protein [Spirochaetota bacterium]
MIDRLIIITFSLVLLYNAGEAMGKKLLTGDDKKEIFQLVTEYNNQYKQFPSISELEQFYSKEVIYNPGSEELMVFVIDTFKVNEIEYVEKMKAWYVVTNFHIIGIVDKDGYSPIGDRYENIGLYVIKEAAKWKIYSEYGYYYLSKEGVIKWASRYKTNKKYRNIYDSVIRNLK